MKASKTLTDNLQLVLVDLIELHLQGKQAHWNLVGKNFRDLHLQLDEIVADAREFTDVTAERMRALHAVPDGRGEAVAKNTSLPPFPEGLIDTKDAVTLVVAMLESTVERMREVHDEVDEEDPTTADLLHGFIAKLEQYAWMVNAENLKATATVVKPSKAYGEGATQ
ncbi:Dps family protein [Arthrobacter roseus]|uniref:Dps family protein n=1 Tax=Arthrobacter roseus TaxID=136274 RepID=UPI001964B2AF|nr:DNA starvation/stationary phase protection protein [Arthrobacter roseus]MBM7847215.1 starvation-inducible DNA-binding protein [Arthrobacter roseus]